MAFINTPWGDDLRAHVPMCMSYLRIVFTHHTVCNWFHSLQYPTVITFHHMSLMILVPRTRIHMNKHMGTKAHTHTHTNTHTLSHTHTHAHKHPQTYTHTPVQGIRSKPTDGPAYYFTAAYFTWPCCLWTFQACMKNKIRWFFITLYPPYGSSSFSPSNAMPSSA